MPGLGWSDLGGAAGACIVLLEEGLNFFVEPQGGHLSEEDQAGRHAEFQLLSGYKR